MNSILSDKVILQRKKNKALIIHNIKNFNLTHSNFIREVKVSYTNVDIKTATEAKNKEIRIKQYKEYLYDLVIFICSRCKDALTITEDIELVNFYDQGGRVMLLSDSLVLQPWRIVLSLFGFDHFTPKDLDFGYDLTLK